MNETIKDRSKKLNDDVKKFEQLVEDIDNAFIEVEKTLWEAEKVISAAFPGKMMTLWRESFSIVRGKRMASYSERVEALNDCINMLEFAEYTLNKEQ